MQAQRSGRHRLSACLDLHGMVGHYLYGKLCDGQLQGLSPQPRAVGDAAEMCGQVQSGRLREQQGHVHMESKAGRAEHSPYSKGNGVREDVHMGGRGRSRSRSRSRDRGLRLDNRSRARGGDRSQVGRQSPSREQPVMCDRRSSRDGRYPCDKSMERGSQLPSNAHGTQVGGSCVPAAPVAPGASLQLAAHPAVAQTIHELKQANPRMPRLRALVYTAFWSGQRSAAAGVVESVAITLANRWACTIGGMVCRNVSCWDLCIRKHLTAWQIGVGSEALPRASDHLTGARMKVNIQNL